MRVNVYFFTLGNDSFIDSLAWNVLFYKISTTRGG